MTKSDKKITEEEKECEKLVKLLQQRFEKDDLGERFVVKDRQPLRYYVYGQHFDYDNLICEKANFPSFKTDILIYEKKEGKKIPRVVIEAKLKTFSSHDVLTYSSKSQRHKILCPFLQYGFVVLNAQEDDLPCRYFNHGEYFDFAYMYKETDFEDFYKNLILKAIETSEKVEIFEEKLRAKEKNNNIKWYRKDVFLNGVCN